MFRGRATALALVLALLSALAASACAKKSAPKGGASPGTTEPGPAPEARRVSPPRDDARPARSAAEACAEGVRPDRAVTREQFEVTLKAPKDVKVGAAVEAEILVTPRTGYKINLKYPSELAMKQGPDGLSLPRSSFDKAHAKELSEARLRFVVPFTVTVAGPRVLHGELGFSVCTPKICITEPDFCVAWEVSAQ